LQWRKRLVQEHAGQETGHHRNEVDERGSLGGRDAGNAVIVEPVGHEGDAETEKEHGENRSALYGFGQGNEKEGRREKKRAGETLYRREIKRLVPGGQAFGRDDVAHGAAHGHEFQQIAENGVGSLLVGFPGKAHDHDPDHGQDRAGEAFRLQAFLEDPGGGQGREHRQHGRDHGGLGGLGQGQGPGFEHEIEAGLAKGHEEEGRPIALGRPETAQPTPKRPEDDRGDGHATEDHQKR